MLGSCTADLVFTMPRFPLAGETLFADAVELHAGGKGLNQAIAVQRLGAAASLVARIGDDSFGKLLLHALRADGVDTRHVLVDRDGSSGIAVPVVLRDGQNSILSAPRANLEMTTGQVEAAADAITGADALLLQFEAPMAVNLRAAELAADAGVPVVLNAAPIVPHPPELLALAAVLIVNEVEAEMLTPVLPPAARPHERALQLSRIAKEAAIVTLGSDGVLVASGETVVHVPAFAVEAVDTVGAGDAFCAAFATARCAGAPLLDATRFAAAAGALSVTRRGAAASLPSRPEVEALLGKPGITSDATHGGPHAGPV